MDFLNYIANKRKEKNEDEDDVMKKQRKLNHKKKIEKN